MIDRSEVSTETIARHAATSIATTGPSATSIATIALSEVSTETIVHHAETTAMTDLLAETRVAMIAHHVETGADMTVGCIEVARERAREFGVISVNADGRVVRFQEKPDEPDTVPGHPDRCLASMGIYVFNRDFLYEQLIRDADTPNSTHDFGKDIIPAVIARYHVMAHSFRDPRSGEQAYWRDVGTIDAFWEANLELIGVTPPLNLYDKNWPIWTYQEQLPPAKFVFDDDDRRGMAVDSMVSGGCVISGAVVRHSLLFSNVRVNSYATVKDSVILPDVEIGRHCTIRKAVIDRYCHIGISEPMSIGVDHDADRARDKQCI
jgi:glucose-1-phosphate adenylyltransferase